MKRERHISIENRIFFAIYLYTFVTLGTVHRILKLTQLILTIYFYQL